jgi:sarcosine/dimethylglycine N-methyltransferase
MEDSEMTNELEGVRDHYRASGLIARLKAVLAQSPEDQRLTPQQLAPIDQFHTRGLAATAELANLAGIKADMSVLDIGSGIGGPARFLAAAHGCRVSGIDLSEEFVGAARYLTERTGLNEQVSFHLGSALELPFDDGVFDLVLLQHVAMNVSERPRLYREVHRVLRPSGRFAMFDVISKSGEPHYPLPWARTPATSFLLSASTTCELVESAGFRALACQDDTEAAKAWILELRASGPPPAPNLSVVMGPEFAELARNLGQNLLEGRLGTVTAVFEAVHVNDIMAG